MKILAIHYHYQFIYVGWDLRVTNLINLNNLSNDESCDNFGCGVVDMSNDDHEGSLKNVIENYFEPSTQQCFLSEEEAYRFHEDYAKINEFSIRKNHFLNKNG